MKKAYHNEVEWLAWGYVVGERQSFGSKPGSLLSGSTQICTTCGSDRAGCSFSPGQFSSPIWRPQSSHSVLLCCWSFWFLSSFFVFFPSPFFFSAEDWTLGCICAGQELYCWATPLALPVYIYLPTCVIGRFTICPLYRLQIIFPTCHYSFDSGNYIFLEIISLHLAEIHLLFCGLWIFSHSKTRALLSFLVLYHWL